MSHLDDFIANYSNAHRNVPPNVRISLLFEDLAKAAKADIAGNDLQPSDVPSQDKGHSKAQTQPDKAQPS